MNQLKICTREEYDALCDWSIAEAASEVIAKLTGKTKPEAMSLLQYAASQKVNKISDRSRAARKIIEHRHAQYQHYLTTASDPNAAWEELARLHSEALGARD